MKKTVIADSPDLIIPPPLQPGDTIGLFCPAGPVRDMDRVENGIQLIEEMGFKIRLLAPLQAQVEADTYLAASDSERAQTLNTLWADTDIKALMAVRGGYGCLRMVDQLDFALVANQPKWLIGFSDLSVLLSATACKAGLISLHGPVLSSLAGSDTASVQRLFSLLKGEYEPYVQETTARIIRSGNAYGRIVVGNLTTIVHLLGTPWEPVFAGAILIIEDTGESMYRIDRMLTQLKSAHSLSNLAAINLGTKDTNASSESEAR
jgi:muramoyltetrapeptide carboxypeptidase